MIKNVLREFRHRISFSSQLCMSVALVWILLTSGCMFGVLKEEIQEEQISYGLSGQIVGIAQTDSNVIALLYAKKEGGLHLYRYTLPDEAGIFTFLVTPGTYLLAVYEDRNHNQRHDPGELAGAWGQPDEIVVPEGPKTVAISESLTELTIELASIPFPVPGKDDFTNDLELMSTSLAKLGAPAKWNDPAFDEMHGSTGYWRPMTFLKQHGTGIYFMAPYDRKKIPVLFVHGATGTPRGWKTMADSLDSKRFQPWAFYYPSGLQLAKISTYLNEMIKGMQTTYGFEKMAVVAHSMGGLVSRSFILKHLIEDGLRTVRVFVSISTPWGGVRMAAKGVKQAPVAIPSWHDVKPQSKFIQDIFSDPLYPQVHHHLIFGYRGDCSLYMENNDGTIELSSQLYLPAQDDAVSVRGIDEDHVGTLTSAKAIAYLNQALDLAFSQSKPQR